MSRDRSDGLASEVAETRWYHTLDLPNGVTTPGKYDLRPVVNRLPIPESLAGARCLDIGSRDGFYAFEMERRGASEVVSIDIDRPEDIHFPFPRPPSSAVQREIDDGNRAFALASRALNSKVRRLYRSIYELGSDEMGSFDFAVLGTLLLHLRDPVRALAAVRDVVSGHLLLNDPISLALTAVHPFRPTAEVVMRNSRPFWWVVNVAGQRRMLSAAGFEVVAAGMPYFVPSGPGWKRAPLKHCLRPPLHDVSRRLLARYGAVHAWALAAPMRR